MKTYTFMGLVCATFFTVHLHAQGTKVEKTIEDIERGKNTYEKIRSMIPKKKTKTDTSAVAPETKPQGVKANTTLVQIGSIDFSKLKTFTENIKACAGVRSANMKYNSITSSIEVQHTGTTEALLKLMEETSKDIFTEKNIESFEEGKIQIKLSPKG